MKEISLTGIQCSGTPHVGNYLGAIRPAIEKANQGDVQSYYFLANFHALNQIKESAKLKQAVREIACTWLACGLDTARTCFYRQSDVPEIFELYTIIANVTAKGLLDRAHAFKSAVDAGRDVNMGLFAYPVLMAADILMFDANVVPVGADQKQHVEIASDIAKAFNAIYGKTLTVPEPLISKDVATIPGLDGRKMSKSYGNTIPLFCDEAELLKCIKRITTDSTAPNEPKDTNHLIFQLYRHFTGEKLDNKIGWGDAKQKLFTAINTYVAPMREKYNYYLNHFNEVEEILNAGAIRAREKAREVLARVRKAIGVA